MSNPSIGSPRDRAAHLMLAIRPSIVRRLGYSALPADLLDDNGIAGWGLGISQLAHDLQSQPSPSDLELEVLQWLLRDQAAERTRWRTAATVLWHLEFVVRTLGPDEVTPTLIATWRRNVEAAFHRRRRGIMAVTARDVRRTDQLLRRLEANSWASPLTPPVKELVATEASIWPSNRPADAGHGEETAIRFLSPRDRRMLDLWVSRSLQCS